MIIKLCLDLVVSVLSAVLGALSFVIPQNTWSQIVSIMHDVYGYLEQGAGVVACFTHFTFLCDLLSVVILFRVFLMGYHMFMWAWRKIPFWGVRD